MVAKPYGLTVHQNGQFQNFNSHPGNRIFLGAMLKTQRESSSKSNTKKSSDVSWKNLIDGPTNWWDNKAKRLNPKAPDFRNKVTLEGKWFSSAPSWVSEKLPPIQTY